MSDANTNTIKTEDGSEVFENDIYLYLEEYIDTHKIEDMHKEPQSRWNAALLYINRYMFKQNKDFVKYNNKNSSIDYSDANLINNICDVYINLCFEYDKEISILGFSKLTGINPDTIYSWGSGEYRPSTSHSDIYKKLSQEREESLSNMLISGRRNPVGLLGALNRHYGWNMGQPRGAAAEQRQSIEQIQQRYALEHQDSTDKPLLEPPKADF